jgi:ketosteroid isomerase-like protein
MAPLTEPQRLLNARKFFLSYSMKQLDEAVRLLSPNVVYTVPGTSQISGVFHGPEEVRRHIVKLIELSRGTFEVLKWMDWMVGETHISALQYAQAQGHGDIYRGHHLYLLESDSDDRLSSIKVFFDDQAAAERFFNWESTN